MAKRNGKNCRTGEGAGMDVVGETYFFLVYNSHVTSVLLGRDVERFLRVNVQLISVRTKFGVSANFVLNRVQNIHV